MQTIMDVCSAGLDMWRSIPSDVRDVITVYALGTFIAALIAFR